MSVKSVIIRFCTQIRHPVCLIWGLLSTLHPNPSSSLPYLEVNLNFVPISSPLIEDSKGTKPWPMKVASGHPGTTLLPVTTREYNSLIHPVVNSTLVQGRRTLPRRSCGSGLGARSLRHRTPAGTAASLTCVLDESQYLEHISVWPSVFKTW